MSLVLVGAGSYGVDYTLGKSKYGSSAITDAGFHGPHSAMQSVEKKNKGINLIISLDEALLVDDIGEFTMELLPLTGNGTLWVKYYFDDGTKSKYFNIYSWNKSSIPDDWLEIDALDPLQSHPQDAMLVKVYIRLKGVDGGSSCLIDYLRLGGYVVSFEPY